MLVCHKLLFSKFSAFTILFFAGTCQDVPRAECAILASSLHLPCPQECKFQGRAGFSGTKKNGGSSYSVPLNTIPAGSQP